ncbi:MAG: hypothetical protein V7631_1928, partial [Massilia sp.]
MTHPSPAPQPSDAAKESLIEYPS